jgi:nicotinate-nucleotide pyrophosphorylase (carboxylating)
MPPFDNCFFMKRKAPTMKPVRPLLPSFAISWPSIWQDHLREGLRDDGFEWDFSGASASRNDQKILEVGVLAKSESVWLGDGLLQAVENVSRDLGAEIKTLTKLTDGAWVKKGQVVCQWKGPVASVLALERPFLNLASYASGIATATRKFVNEVQRACPVHPPRVTCTRKTLPGYRNIAVSAVVAGGGMPHRLGLDSGVLLKENHIRAAGSIGAAVKKARLIAPHLLKVEVEVRNLKELQEALTARVDVVMLDNFSPTLVRQAIEKIHSIKNDRPWVEVSGGLTLDTIGSFAIPGVDVLSVGALTHSVIAADFSMLERRLLPKASVK